MSTLLDWVGPLSRGGHAHSHLFSKGMAAAGRASPRRWSMIPSVVFLDEPMSGLDPIGRKEIRDLILRLRAEGKTVFMNTHILHGRRDGLRPRRHHRRRTDPLRRGASRTSSPRPAMRRSDDLRCWPASRRDGPFRSSRSVSRRSSCAAHGRSGLEAERQRRRTPSQVLRRVLGQRRGTRVLSVTPHRVSLENDLHETRSEERRARQAP